MKEKSDEKISFAKKEKCFWINALVQKMDNTMRKKSTRKSNSPSQEIQNMNKQNTWNTMK